MAIYSVKRFSKAKDLGYTESTIEERLPKLYWELKKVSDKMKSHPFNKVRIDLLDDADYPNLYIAPPKEILSSLNEYREDKTDDSIIYISNNDRPIFYDFEKLKWILYDKRFRKNMESDDKGVKYHILSEWSKLIDSWKNEYANEWLETEDDKRLFFDYLDKLYKEVERIRV